MELVTIVIPAYNEEEKIEQVIKTAVQQTHEKIEIIIVNDGSTDGTALIAEQWQKQDHRVRLISQENSGVSVARNTGIAHANGKYITFVDGDDLLEDRFIEVLYQNIVTYQADVSACRWDNIYKDEEVTRDTSQEVVAVYERDRAIAEVLKGEEVSASATAKMYKLSLFKDVKFPVGVRYIEDAYMIIELLLQIDCLVQTNLKLYKYIHTAGSIMYSDFDLETEYGIIRAHTRNLNLVQKHLPELVPLARQRLAWAYLRLYDRLILFEKIGSKDEKELRQEVLNRRDSIEAGDYFNRSRKLAVRLLRFSPWLYKQLVKYRQRNYQPNN